MTTPVTNEVTTDVLVVGGGLAGCWAAIRARQLGSEVVLADKGYVGRTGVSKFASSHMRCYFPEDDHEDAIKEIVEGGDYLNDQRWVETVVKDSFARVSEMDGFGVEFEKENGRLKRVPTKGRISAAVTFKSPQMMLTMRKTAERLGVKVLDRVFVNDLLVRDGRVVGATGIHTTGGDFFVIHSKAVVLATGACTLRSIYYGHQFSTGDAYAMAYRAGGTLTSMECIKHNISSRDYNTAGTGSWVGSGGRYINGRGEAFMARYHPWKDRANLTWVSQAMAREVREGRGPIYMDLSGADREYLAVAQRVMPWAVLALTRSGIDIVREKWEVVPACLGSSGSPAGIRVDVSGTADGVPGLFATGDAAAMLCLGMGAGFGGFNLAYCAVFGYRSGEAAHRSARALKSGDRVAPGVLSGIKTATYAPLERGPGLAADTVLYEIQKNVFPYQICILKSRDRLIAALARIREIRQDMVPVMAAPDIHELIKVHETSNMALYAEMSLKASEARTESRGMHRRDDYPERDDRQWVKWTHLKDAGGDMALWTEPLPGEAFSHFALR